MTVAKRLEIHSTVSIKLVREESHTCTHTQSTYLYAFGQKEKARQPWETSTQNSALINFALIQGKPLGMLSDIYALQPLTFTANKKKKFLCKSCKQDIIVPTSINYVYHY